MHCAGSYPKGEIQSIAQAVGKEEFGCREYNVIFLYSQNTFGIVFRTVGHIVLQVDAAFGEACTTGAIEPEGAVIFAGLCRLQLRGRLERPRLKIMDFRALASAAFVESYDDHVAQVLKLGQNWLYLLPQFRVNEQNQR